MSVASWYGDSAAVPSPIAGGGKDCHAGFGMLSNYGRCTRPSVGGFIYSRQGEPNGARSVLSRGVTTVSPYWYIRGRPDAADNPDNAPRRGPTQKGRSPRGRPRAPLRHRLPHASP